jgi:hypothetical protein
MGDDRQRDIEGQALGSEKTRMTSAEGKVVDLTIQQHRHYIIMSGKELAQDLGQTPM